MTKNMFLDSDYNNLDRSIKRQDTIKLADVKDQIERVAFDVVRFRDDDTFTNLWRVENTPDGEVLVAMYEDDNLESRSESDWAVMPDKSANVNVFYKNEPITRFASDKIGIPKEEVKTLCRALPKKLASDKNFVNNFLSSELSEKDREALFTKYPELKG